MAEYFIIGIGGTGMRCLESVIHLCAMGMFDDTTIHLLALDTDKDNGNFSRVKELIGAYKNCKNNTQTALKDTFFSANIKYYGFSPDYERKSTFQNVFGYKDTQLRDPGFTAVADLVLDENVQTFDLKHGYRAQTHLGSMMMYHSILEAARDNMQNDMKLFVTELSRQTEARVFILGSVFGGTGASSIPVIPRALSKAAEIMQLSGNILANAFFGSTLLTAYFSFAQPNATERGKEKIIATSDKFALNSKVAMMFYNDDVSVKNTYQRFYMMGTEDNKARLMDDKDGNKNKISKVITGGAEQKNNCHFIELLAACAAHHFLNVSKDELKATKDNHETEYLYRAVDADDDQGLHFRDFVDQSIEDEFAKKLGMLTVFSLLCNGEDKFVEGVSKGGHDELSDYKNLPSSQVNDGISKYFRLFHFHANANGTISNGWLRQVYNSGKSPYNLNLLNADLFGRNTLTELMKVKWNKNLYATDLNAQHHYSVGLLGSKFDSFKKELIKQSTDDNRNIAGISDKGEQLFKLIYDTLVALYNF